MRGLAVGGGDDDGDAREGRGEDDLLSGVLEVM